MTRRREHRRAHDTEPAADSCAVVHPLARIDARELVRLATLRNSHFFERETMEFFDSQLVGVVRALRDGRVVFVTSEQFSFRGIVARRLYTLRALTDLGVETIGRFQQHECFLDAYHAAMALEDCA